LIQLLDGVVQGLEVEGIQVAAVRIASKAKEIEVITPL
jgi:hypothetical protein